MKLIKPYTEIIDQEGYDLQSIYKHIEKIARTCYKSEDGITDDSAEKFVNMKLISKGHLAMLEHGTVYLSIPREAYSNGFPRYLGNPYSKSFADNENHLQLITTNLRVLLENNWLDDLQYLCEPTEHHEKRVSVRFVCDRGVSHELCRHRVFSFAQESTRFCNYSKKQFGNQITFTLPCWFEIKPNKYGYAYAIEEPTGYYRVSENSKENYDAEDVFIQIHTDYDRFIHSLCNAEMRYFDLLNQGWQAQQARAVLPNALKTEVVMTGFLSDWQGKIHVYKTDDKTYNQVRTWSPETEEIVRNQYTVKNNLAFHLSGFFPLRTAPTAHPQMQELAKPLYEEFKQKNLL